MRPAHPLLERLQAVWMAHGARPALCGPRRTLSHAELGQTVQRLAAALGPQAAGRRILLRVNADPVAAAVLFLACLQAGAVPALADPAWTEPECRELARRHGCTQWIGDESWPGDAPLAPGAGEADLVQQELAADELPPLDPACAFIRFSSGSTGLPRAIEFSAAGALAIAEAWSQAAGLGPDDRILCYATLNNGLAFNTTLLPGLLAGASLRLEPKFLTARSVLAAAAAFRPTVFVAFPLVYEFLARRPAAELRAALGGTRLRLSSAAALGAAVKAAWADGHGLPIGNYYGIAEVGPLSFNDGRDTVGLGRLLPGVELVPSAADDAGRPTTVRTPWMGLRYVRGAGPAATDDALQAGRPYATSDRVAVDADGGVGLLGRSDDVLNLNGKKVSLGALRETLAPLLGGAEFVLVPVHQDAGSFLSLHVESTAMPVQDIRARCAGVLPPHAIPRQVVLHERLPRSSAGKVLVARLQPEPALA